MKLELFQRLKIKAGISILEDNLAKLDAEDFEFVVEQAARVEQAVRAEQQRRGGLAAPERKS